MAEPIRPNISIVFRGDIRHIPQWRQFIRTKDAIYELESVAREGKRQDKMVRAIYVFNTEIVL